MLSMASLRAARLRLPARAAAPPAWLVVAGLLVAVLGLLPIAYLVILAASSQEAATLVFRDRTLGVLGRTLALAGTVNDLSSPRAVPKRLVATRR